MTANLTRTVAALAAAAAVIGIAAPGCSGDGGSATTEGGAPAVSLVQDGTLTVCSDIPYKPFEYPDESDPTRFQGYDVDTIDAIAAAHGWRTDWVVTPFDGIVAALEEGSCDVIASAMPITDDHHDQVDFTDGYFDAALALVVHKADEDALTGIAALAGMKIGVRSGGAGESYLDAHNPGATIVKFPGDTELFAALDDAEVQAVLADLPVSEQHTSDDDSLSLVGTYPTGETFGFAVKRGANPELLAALNAGIAQLDASGERERIFHRYFPDAPVPH